MKLYKTILVGVDGSIYSEAALETAVGLAKSLNAKLIIATVRVIPEYPSGRVRPIGVQVTEIDPTIKEELKEMLDKYESEAKKAGLNSVSIDLIKSEETVGSELVKEAEKVGADLVIVGSRGLTGIKRVLLGSVAGYVTKFAHCDTMVVRREE